MAKRTKNADETLPERIAAECLLVRTRLLSRTLTRLYDEALRPLGMTAAQMNLLVVVANRGPVAQSEIVQLLSMEKSTLSRNVERMRTQGWIATEPSGVGRGLLLSLTPQGHRQLEKSAPLWEAAQAEARELLGQRDADALKRLVNSLWSGPARP